ncbi:MAG: calcium-binding protein [Piscinibacter sp.]
MAQVTAHTALEITTIDFSGDWLNPANSIVLRDNVNVASAQGRVYEDELRVTIGEEPRWNDHWCGTGLAFNPTTRAITAGTLTGFFATDFNGSSHVEQFAVEGISYSAVAFYNAMVSATAADDLAMVRSFFAGNDTFNLSPGADDVWAWTGNDTLRGLAGNDTLNGDAGNDWLDGGSGVDTMRGGTGNDVYVVERSTDVVVEAAAAGTDTVRSSVSRALGSNQENLVLTGSTAINGSGNTLANALLGNAAANTLNGGAGNDIVNGGAGNDRLTGGTGLDSFRFTTAPNSTGNADRLLDFSSADDRLQFDNAVFTALGAAGALPATMFRLGTTAADATDRIVYNQASGALYYDADGSGAGAALLVATLVAGTPLVLADVFVI